MGITVLDFEDEALDERFSQLREDVEQYEESWWIHDEWARKIWSNEPALLKVLSSRTLEGHVVQTIDVHRAGPTWRHPRPALHKQIVTSVLREYLPTPDMDRPPAFLLYGGPGSGKSSSLRPLVQKPGMSIALPLDADDVRVELPEYAGGRGSAVVQEECAYVTYGELRSTCLMGNPNQHGICIDAVGDPKWSVGDYHQLNEAGYRVYALVAQCPLDQAVRRIKRRAIETGRFVDVEFAQSVGDRPKRALDALLAAQSKGEIHLAGWGLFDTSDGQPRGAPLVLDGDGTFGSAGAAAVRPAL
ncbi:zeta toxin family protein [Rhodococcus pyridinivorans]|uniref:zeta toxin family protein n=1 Tax=Rhodococcus pyridinivorans TaxID=103816 RepID=UPI001E46CC64|nr:zeta toxin family protein [Rhodococcus pyridinivorans]MCD5421424.1 zeta toxin family protein [Rhodococcus pyridinivorans]